MGGSRLRDGLDRLDDHLGEILRCDIRGERRRHGSEIAGTLPRTATCVSVGREEVVRNVTGVTVDGCGNRDDVVAHDGVVTAR